MKVESIKIKVIFELLFLICRVELKVKIFIDIVDRVFITKTVPNLPCGVERPWLELLMKRVNRKFLICRVELKAKGVLCTLLAGVSCRRFLICRVELKGGYNIYISVNELSS